MSDKEIFNCSKCQLVYVLPTKCDHYQEQQLAALKADKEQDNALFVRHAQEYQAEIKQLQEQLKEAIDILEHYSHRMDSGGTARQFLAKIKHKETTI